MSFLVGGMMVAFLLAGLFVGFIGLRELICKIICRRRFLRLEAEVTTVSRKVYSGRSSGRSKPMVMHFPNLTFTTPSGEEVSFQSEIGSVGDTPRYLPGQRLLILYDPQNELKPMIDSFSGVWLTPMMVVLAGLGFLVGAFMIYAAFWEKIVGR